MQRITLFVSVLFCLWPALASAGSGSEKLHVAASNYPLAYFAERIGGTRVKVVLPVPPKEDPAFWKPAAEDIGRLQQADLILLNGADYEKWLSRVSLPRLKMVDTSAGFKPALIKLPDAVTHSHGPGGMHSHGAIAYTTWLDFKQAALQAEAVAAAMMRIRPEWKSLLEANLRGLQSDLTTLDEALLRIGRRYHERPLLGSHPVYQYFARRYGFDMASVHWEPDAMPAADEWTQLAASLKARPARWMIWEAEPAPEIAAKLKAQGAGSVIFDPCANRPADGDFLNRMQANLKRLDAALN